MNDTDEVKAKLAALIERRQVLLRGLGVFGAVATLGACKHLGVTVYPDDATDRGGGDNGGGGGDDADGVSGEGTVTDLKVL